MTSLPPSSGTEQQLLQELLALRLPQQHRRWPELPGGPFLRPIPVPRDAQTQQKAAAQLPLSPLLQQRTLHQRLPSGEPRALDVHKAHLRNLEQLWGPSVGPTSENTLENKAMMSLFSPRPDVPSLGESCYRGIVAGHLRHHTRSLRFRFGRRRPDLIGFGSRSDHFSL